MNTEVIVIICIVSAVILFLACVLISTLIFLFRFLLNLSRGNSSTQEERKKYLDKSFKNNVKKTSRIDSPFSDTTPLLNNSSNNNKEDGSTQFTEDTTTHSSPPSTPEHVKKKLFENEQNSMTSSTNTTTTTTATTTTTTTATTTTNNNTNISKLDSHETVTSDGKDIVFANDRTNAEGKSSTVDSNTVSELGSIATNISGKKASELLLEITSDTPCTPTSLALGDMSSQLSKYPSLQAWFEEHASPNVLKKDVLPEFSGDINIADDIMFGNDLVKTASIPSLIHFLISSHQCNFKQQQQHSQVSHLSSSSSSLIGNQIDDSKTFNDIRDIFFATYTSFISQRQLIYYLWSFFDQNTTSEKTKSNIVDFVEYWIQNFFDDFWAKAPLNNKLHQSKSDKMDTICILIRFILSIEENTGFKKDTLLNAIQEHLVGTGHDTKVTHPLSFSWDERLKMFSEHKDVADDNDEQGKEEGVNQENGEDEEIEGDQEGDDQEEEEEDLTPQYPENWTPISYSTSPDVKKFDILAWPAIEVARQLTLLEAQYFQKIHIYELVSERFIQTNMDKETLIMSAMTHRFNNLSLWACQFILKYKDLEKRAQAMMYMIDLIESLVSMNNFNCVMSLFGALNNLAIHRLRKTWDAISEDHVAMYEMLGELLSPNQKHKQLRKVVESCPKPPIIPYIGLYLSDLVAIESSGPDFFEKRLLNVNKKRHITKVIKSIQTMQKHCQYPFEKVKYLQDVLGAIVPDAPSMTLMTEEEMYEESLLLEPRMKPTAPVE